MTKENKHPATLQVLGKLGSSENRKHTSKMLSYFQAKFKLRMGSRALQRGTQNHTASKLEVKK